MGGKKKYIEMFGSFMAPFHYRSSEVTTVRRHKFDYDDDYYYCWNTHIKTLIIAPVKTIKRKTMRQQKKLLF